jgi:hypothetical protein
MRRLLNRLVPRAEAADRGEQVVIVSGLPRSGTSMMMKMLEAGGLEVFVDGIREADVDNPGGYYELERVKKLREGDVEWVRQARGKVVKVISELLRWLPPESDYRIVFMQRDMEEILRSQQRMLAHRHESRTGPSDEQMTELFRAHLEEMDGWLAAQDHMDVLQVHYSDLLADPLEPLWCVNGFLGGKLDVGAMAAVVDPSLYRSRS